MFLGFFVAQLVKKSTCNAWDLGSVPGLGRAPREGKGHPLWYSGLKNSMDCIVRGVTKSWTRLSDFHFQAILRKTNWEGCSLDSCWPLSSLLLLPTYAKLLHITESRSLELRVTLSHPGLWVNVKEYHPSPCPDALSLLRLSVLTLQPLSKKTCSGQGLHAFITTGS